MHVTNNVTIQKVRRRKQPKPLSLQLHSLQVLSIPAQFTSAYDNRLTYFMPLVSFCTHPPPANTRKPSGGMGRDL